MKIKILVPPLLHHPPQLRQIDHSVPLLPPYGPACLISCLRKNGYTPSLEDISLWTEELKDLIIALDNQNMHERIANYLIRDIPDSTVDSFAEKLFQYVSKDKCDLFGFSVLSRLGLPCALLLAKKVKEKTGAAIVFGGPLVTEYMEYKNIKKGDEFLNSYKFIDYIIFGEGSVPLLMLLEYLQGRRKIDEVPNLAYRVDGKIITHQRTFFPIEDVPLPDFDDLPLNMYGHSGYHLGKTSSKFIQLPYQITRGCTQRCSFCNFYLIDPRVELKTHDKVISELSQLKERYKVNHFFFCECRINVSYRYLEKLCDLIIENRLNIIWDTVTGINDMDGNLLKKMKSAGCHSLAWGIESGSEKVLKIMHKRFDVLQAENILRESRMAGIVNVVNFMTGFLGEKEEDVNQTVVFIQKNAPYIDKVRVFDFALVPYAPIFDHPEDFGIENIVGDHKSPIGFGRIGFDEIGGLKWEDKLQQKARAYRRVKNAVERFIVKRSNNNNCVIFIDKLWRIIKGKDSLHSEV